MSKQYIKKLLLGSLIILQLTNKFGSNTLNKVYAKENQKNQICLNENGKILQLIGFKINGYENITFGYLYIKDNSIYLKDARNGKIFNLTKISKDYISIDALYTDAKEVLTDKQISKGYINKEEVDNITKSFYIKQGIIKTGERNNITFDTFGKKDFNDEELKIANSSFVLNDEMDYKFHSSCTTNEYNENLEQDNTPDNNYKLGILERYEEYPYYSNIYQKMPLGVTNQMGIITGYYVFNNNQIIAILKTQKEIDEFIEKNQDKIDNYTFKASFYNGTNVKNVLQHIDNNQPISDTYTTRFIDYNPVCKKLKRN